MSSSNIHSDGVAASAKLTHPGHNQRQTMDDDSKSMVFLKIAELNHQALVFSAVSGSKDDATECLIQALLLLENIPAHDRQNPLWCTKTYDGLFLQQHLRLFPHSNAVENMVTTPRVISVAPTISSTTQQLLHNDKYDIQHYENAVLLQGDVPCETNATTVVLLYNLALFNHQEAIASNQSLCYENAVRMYSQCIQLLFRYPKQCLHTKPTLRLVLAASLHNMGCCQTVGFFNLERAAECQLQLALVLKESARYEQNLRIPKELHFFVTALALTLFCEPKGGLHAAPAA